LRLRKVLVFWGTAIGAAIGDMATTAYVLGLRNAAGGALAHEGNPLMVSLVMSGVPGMVLGKSLPFGLMLGMAAIQRSDWLATRDQKKWGTRDQWQKAVCLCLLAATSLWGFSAISNMGLALHG
jgi:hypothetical protein